MPDPILKDGAAATGLGDSTDTLGEAGKRKMEEYKLTTDIAKAEKAQAGAGKAAQSKIMSEFGGALSKPYEEFKPSQESMSGFAALGSLLMVAGGMMGSGGRMAGIGAMNNIAGMLKGYQSGRKDLYEQERQQFENNMKTFEKNRGLIKEAFDRALKMAPQNLTAAQTKLRQDLASLGANVPAEIVSKSGLVHAASTHDTFHTNTTSTLDQLKERLGKTKAEEAAREADIKAKKSEKELASSGAPIKIQYEGKTVLADRSGKPLRDESGNVIEAGASIRSAATNQQITRRLLNATTQATESYKAITDMPEGISTGILPYLSSKEGLTSYLQNYAGRAASPDEVNILNTYFKGVGRNLATVEASGVATGLVGLANSFESLAPQAGDSNYSIAGKMAEGRAVIENGIKVALTDPSVTPEQKKLLEDNLSSIKEVIPYTRKDINDALRKASGSDTSVIKSTTETVKPTLVPTKTFEDFLTYVRKDPRYEGYSDEELRAYYNKKFGGQ